MSPRVVLFTRTSRPSGAQMAWRLFQAGFTPLTVVVERRGRMLKTGKISVLAPLFRLGPHFIATRLLESLSIRAHYYFRKFFGEKFKDPVYLSIEEFALDHPIEFYEVGDHNGPETVELLRRLQPDIGVLTNTRRIKREILEIPRHGFLNLHLSALPRYAGLDSIFWALYHGEKEIGVTVHQAAEKIDRGDLVIQRKIPVSPLDDEQSLYEKTLWLGTGLMVRAVKQVVNGTFERIPQDPTQGSYFSWPRPAERKALRKRREEERRRSGGLSGQKRIVHVITRMTRGGAQENTLATVRGLVRKGYSVSLVTGPSWGREGEILSEALEEGLEIILIPELQREIRPLTDLIAFWKLRAWLGRSSCALLHTHMSKAGLLGRLAAWFLGIPVVIHTPHGHVFHSYFPVLEEKLFVFLEHWAAARTDFLIALTKRCRDEHLDRRVGTLGQWVIVSSGVNEKHFAERSRERSETMASLGIPQGQKVIGFFGRLAPVKGCGYLIEALAAIFESFPQSRCLIVGDGEERGKLEKRVNELGLQERVHFVGHQEDISGLLAVVDVLVVPSLNEGMGRVIVEAGFLAKAVVGTRVGGIPDLIEDGKTGFLVEPRSAPEIAQAVVRLLKDPELARRLGVALQTKALAGFTEDQMVEKLYTLYQAAWKEKGILVPISVQPSEPLLVRSAIS